MSALARDEEKRQTDREEIFANSDEEVFDVQIVDQASAYLIAKKCSDYRGNCAEQRSDKQ